MQKGRVGFSERTAFSHYHPEKFTPKEREILNPFFSNLDRPVYVVSGLPSSVVAALFGRQSQTAIPPRTLFLKEFVGERIEKASCVSEFVDVEKARKFLRKNFVERGHGSLGDLVVVALGFEEVSQIGAKALEDGRIGVAPLERSTRYGRFDQKDKEGRYKYVRDPEIMTSKYAFLFCQTADALLETYSSLIGPVTEALKKKYPDKNSWWLKNRTLDLVRVLLPAAVCTNVSLVLDGRAVEHLILKLDCSGLKELRELGEMVAGEIKKTVPSLIGRVEGEFGQAWRRYRKEREKAMSSLGGEIIEEIETCQGARVELVDYDREGEEKVLAAILWPFAGGVSERELRKKIGGMRRKEKEKILSTYLGERESRQQLPGRALERVYYKFEIVAPFGIYRDLQRHRMLTQERQNLTFDYGYEIPVELEELGFGKIVAEKTEMAREVFYRVKKDLPLQAQYITTFGALTSWYFWLNLREAVYLTELRTGKGAHPRYKQVAQEIRRKIETVHPLFSQCFKFVDMSG